MIKEWRSRRIVWEHAFSITQRLLRIPSKFNLKKTNKKKTIISKRQNSMHTHIRERCVRTRWEKKREKETKLNQCNVKRMRQLYRLMASEIDHSVNIKRSVGSFFVKLMFIRRWKGIISNNNNKVYWKKYTLRFNGTTAVQRRDLFFSERMCRSIGRSNVVERRKNKR